MAEMTEHGRFGKICGCKMSKSHIFEIKRSRRFGGLQHIYVSEFEAYAGLTGISR